MSRISDSIEVFLKKLIDEEINKEVLIQRNQLADEFNCAPSQINYVLSTRFTYEKGYVIESKRGGGGCIFIKKLQYDKLKEKKLELIYKSIGNSITYQNALEILNHLTEIKLISDREYEVMKVAINDRTLVNVENRNCVRADIIRAMMSTVFI